MTTTPGSAQWHAADCLSPAESHKGCPVGSVTVTPSPQMRSAVLDAAGLPDLAPVAYRWRGVSPKGQPEFGAWELGDLAAHVEGLFAAGWRSLTVCTGPGPVPPPAVGPAGVVAEICNHPETGRRTWWAESAQADAGSRAEALAVLDYIEASQR